MGKYYIWKLLRKGLLIEPNEPHPYPPLNPSWQIGWGTVEEAEEALANRLEVDRYLVPDYEIQLVLLTVYG